MTSRADSEAARRRLRERRLPRQHDLVSAGSWSSTFGNVSGIDRELGLIAIKPSGVDYDELSPGNMVVLDLDGKKVEGDLNPSSDTKTHVRLYREFPDIGGVVHTHSRHATAWAQARRPLPCLGTTHADYFHGEVPCTAVISDEQIGMDYEEETAVQIIDAFRKHRLPRHARRAGGLPRSLHLGQGRRRGRVPRVDAGVRGGDGGDRGRGSTRGSAGIKQTLLDKHYLRKHGKNAYYGQGGGHG